MKNLDDFFYDFLHKISYYKARVSKGSVENRWLGGGFLMVYRKNAGRLGSGFISVCLKTRWLLGQRNTAFRYLLPRQRVRRFCTTYGCHAVLDSIWLRTKFLWCCTIVTQLWWLRYTISKLLNRIVIQHVARNTDCQIQVVSTFTFNLITTINFVFVPH